MFRGSEILISEAESEAGKLVKAGRELQRADDEAGGDEALGVVAGEAHGVCVRGGCWLC